MAARGSSRRGPRPTDHLAMDASLSGLGQRPPLAARTAPVRRHRRDAGRDLRAKGPPRSRRRSGRLLADHRLEPVEGRRRPCRGTRSRGGPRRGTTLAAPGSSLTSPLVLTRGVRRGGLLEGLFGDPGGRRKSRRAARFVGGACPSASSPSVIRGALRGHEHAADADEARDDSDLGIPVDFSSPAAPARCAPRGRATLAGRGRGGAARRRARAVHGLHGERGVLRRRLRGDGSSSPREPDEGGGGTAQARDERAPPRPRSRSRRRRRRGRSRPPLMEAPRSRAP